MGSLLQDLRYAARVLLKKPGFSIVAISTLTLGIGANTAIFTVVDAVLLQPLPYSHPERLMLVGSRTPSTDLFAATKNKFLFWREQSQSFAAMATYRTLGSANFTAGNGLETAGALRVTVDFLRVLGLSPALGRSFSAKEDAPGGERVAILTNGLWKRRFGADPRVLGTQIGLNGLNYSIIGVMPPEFQFEAPADVVVPLQLGSGEIFEGGSNYPVIGRLKPGVSEAQAFEEMKLVAEHYRSLHPGEMGKQESTNVVNYHQRMVRGVRPALLVLLGAVGFVLLIGCANVANLQLTRASARRREMAIRVSLGAGRGRLVRQLLTEGMALSMIGGAAGMLLAVWGVEVLKTFIPEGLVPRVGEIRFDWRVLIFTALAALLSGIVFGLAPALQSARREVYHALKESSGEGAGAVRRWGLRNVLVIGEIALALVLLVGATLLIRTFANLRGVEPGFDPRNVLTFQITPRGPQYQTTAQNAEFNTRAIERITALPGVEAAATTCTLPLDHWLNLPIEFAGKEGQVASVEWRMISPDYFRVMRMNVREGAHFRRGIQRPALAP